MTSANYTAVVNVRAERSPDGWFALSSDDLPEFFMGGRDLNVLLGDAPVVIAKLFDLNYGMKVDVKAAEAPATPSDQIWRSVEPQFVACRLAA